MTSTLDPTFLGLDLSTQQLKAALVTQDGSLLYEQSVHFDRDLARFGTTNGAIRGNEEGEVYCPVVLWIAALDLLMDRLKASGKVDFSRIQGIGGAAQQHGSVYWSETAPSLLANLDPAQPLAIQLDPMAFSTTKCPIWQDSSTTGECKLLEDTLGGAQRVSNISGSRAYERFTGVQILKMYRKQPSIYSLAARISLVSSFLASLFLCKIAPIENSDASGMNLMNVKTLKWDDILLHICGGPTLRSKLGPEPVLGGEVIGNVGNWWVKRWGFSTECIVSPFTGDNSGTIVSLSSPGDLILSLGTSTTLLISLPPTNENGDAPRHTTTSHLLSHPTTPHAYIAMLCYKNGALAREFVRNHYADGQWAKFDQLVLSTPPGNDGYTGIYFPLHEIIPPNVVGDFFFKESTPIHSFPDKKYHPRAILESQLLSIRSRVESILSHNEEAVKGLKRLLITGGASTNEVIRQMASDVMGLDAYLAESKEGGSVGGALLGLFAWWRLQGNNGTFEDMKLGWKKDPSVCFRKVASPHHETSGIYGGLIEKYRRCEQRVVEYCERAAEDDWHNWKEESEQVLV